MSQKTVSACLAVDSDLQTGVAGTSTMPEYRSKGAHTAVVAPEEMNGTVPNFGAFAEEESLYLALFPQGILNDLKDKDNLEKRQAAVNMIQSTIQGCKDRSLLLNSLPELVNLVTTPLNDSNFKIVLTGLQLMGDLIDQVGNQLAPFLTPLISSYLGKVGSNKYAVKHAGMRVLVKLMHVLGPWPVISTVAVYGLTHRMTKVREETLNIIISSLLTFPASSFKLPQLVEITAPLLMDSKQRVRQASLETLAVLADRMGRKKANFITSTISEMERRSKAEDNENLSLWDAYQTRLARKGLPNLNVDGLVDHVVNVTSGHNTTDEFTGPDVDWILAAGKGSASSSGKKKSATGGQSSCTIPGPLKSAGKRLPWENEHPKSKVNGLQPALPVMPLRTLPTSPPKPETYLDIYKRRAALRLSNGGNLKQREAHNPLANSTWFRSNPTVPVEKGEAVHTGVHDPLNPDALGLTWPGTVSYGVVKASNSTSRQISADAANLAAALQNPQKTTNGGIAPNETRPPSKPLVRNPFTSFTHPASTSKPQITKPSGATAKHPAAKPSAGKPYSVMASVTQPAVSMIRQPPAVRQQSPTQIEQSFLVGHAVDEELDSEYYNIPVENNVLDESLTSSVSSLCPPRDPTSAYMRTGTVDILSHIRKEAASRKAEKKSAQYSVHMAASTSITTGSSTMNTSEKTEHEDAVVNGSTTYKLLDTPQYRTAPKQKKPSPTGAISSHQSVLVSDVERTSLDDTQSLKPKKKKKSVTKAASADSNQGKTPQVAPVCATSSISAPVYRHGMTSSHCDGAVNNDDLVELTPLPNPEQELRVALKTLANDAEDWEHLCVCLVSVRRMAAHHRHLVIGQLHSLVMAVDRQVKNLRSQVARGAIACLGDLFSLLGREMEQVLDNPVKTLLQVSSKSNVFYREDAEKALLEMINNVSHCRSLPALINGGASNANTTVRRNVSMLVCAAVEHCTPSRFLRSHRDILEKTMTAVAQLLSDADPGARYFARKTLYQFLSLAEFEQQAVRVLSTSHQMKVQGVIDTLRTKGLGKPPDQQAARLVRQAPSSVQPSADSSPPRPRALPSMNPSVQTSAKKTKRRRSSVADVAGTYNVGESAIPHGMFDQLRGSDWKERDNALQMLEDFVISRHGNIGSLLITRIFDVLNERMMDMNSKVNHRALLTFQHIIPSLGELLYPVLATTIKAVSTNFASHSTAIHSSAMVAVDTLIRNIDCTMLMAPFGAAVQESNSRIQPIMMRKLADIVVSTHEKKPALVHRVALPILWKTLSANSTPTSDLKQSTMCLCQSLYISMGPGLLESAPPTVVDRLRRLIRSLKINVN